MGAHSLPRSSPHSISRSLEKLNVGTQSYQFPSFEHPSHELLRENGFIQHKYYKYHAKALRGGLAIIFYIQREEETWNRQITGDEHAI